ncbi:MAG: glycine oxidase ThiO [Hahellaceae bacterium]|nr:glycine oxidase ThiO [Hahellaceae bacterium]
MRVIIIGAGAIGLMQARELAQKGVAVTLIEKGLCAREASWAGGGIVSPLYPWRYSAPVTALASWSQSYYPNLVQSLEAESGIDPELSRHGLLMLSVDDPDDALAWAGEGGWIQSVDKQELYRLEPELREGFNEALWMPQVASIRNPRLARALRASITAEKRITLVEECAVHELMLDGDKVTGVATDKGEFEAEQVIVTAGAWTGGLLEGVGVHLPIEPVRGQMILFKARPGLVKRVVMRDGKYVIPRRDGRVLAGSTLEHVGFDKTTTEVAKNTLADLAIDMFPGLADAQIEHHWAGLRPAAPMGIPFIGEVPEVAGLWVNAGHYRNGLVLAPASVRLLSALLLNETVPVDPVPYQLAR